jgi:hypothetical protein
MHNKIPKNNWLVIIIIIFEILCIQSCTPPPPQPWFIESIKTNNIILPNDVKIQIIENDARNHTDCILISNNSRLPLYILAEEEGTSYNYGKMEVTPNIGKNINRIPAIKLENKKVFMWDMTSDIRETKTPLEYEWKDISDEHISNILRLCINYSWEKFDEENDYSSDVRTYRYYLFSNMEERNVMDGGDSRPNDVKIPNPQNIAITMIYDNNEITLPLIITYALNTTYHKDFNILELFSYIPFIIIIILIVLILGVIIYCVYLEKKK